MDVKETMIQILMNYGPCFLAIGTALGSAAAMLSKIKSVFKKSNIEELKNGIDKQNESISDIRDLNKTLIEENQLLKQQNADILKALNKIE